MPKYVRVRRSNGSTFTTSAGHAKRRGLTVIKEPAVDRFGRVLPPTPAPTKRAAAPTPAPAKTAGDKTKEAAK